MKKLARASDALSYSNLADANIMKKQQWGLLPTVATFSTVIPATLLAGGMTKMIDFPKELGKLSSTNKMGRIAGKIKIPGKKNLKRNLDQLKFHTNLSSKCDRIGLVLEHGPVFREVKPTILYYTDSILYYF